MAKHGKPKKDVAATGSNPVIKVLKSSKTAPDPSRLAKDIEIVDKGWNNTTEGQEDLRTKGATRKSSGKGKHKA